MKTAFYSSGQRPALAAFRPMYKFFRSYFKEIEAISFAVR
jgi:hypothetical protein